VVVDRVKSRQHGARSLPSLSERQSEMGISPSLGTPTLLRHCKESQEHA